MESLPGDHKLITTHVSAIDVGNYRFIYHIYVKGSTFDISNKTYLSMSVQIPFPGDDKEIKDAIRNDLLSLIESLKAEGVLTDAGYIFEDEPDVIDNNNEEEDNNTCEEDYENAPKWIGQPFAVEFLNKGISSDWLISLQGKVIDIIKKYNLQNYEYCTISGTSSGSDYRLYKGNLLQSTIIRDAFRNASYRCSYKESFFMLLNEYDSMYSVDDFNKLYDISNNSTSDIVFNDLAKIIKMMFKGSGTKIVVKIGHMENGIYVNITFPSKAAGNEYHLTYQSDRWWIHAHGRLDNLDPISMEDEKTACDLFLRIIDKYTNNS